MPLHPDAQAYLQERDAAGSRPYNELTVEQAREQSIRLSQLSGPREAVTQVRDRSVPGPRGEIPIRIYTPQGDAPFPILVYFHGGGWVVGSLETADFACRQLTNAVPCLVVSVDYRHAPEHKFPAAPEDAYAATQWVAEHAAEFGGDPARLAVSGHSAGGNLAAVVSLMARDRDGPHISLQIPQAPVADFSFDTPSYLANAEGYGLTRGSMEWFWKQYLASDPDGWHPYASPLRAEDLSGVAPAFVLTAEFDPLRDEGEAYAARLREAGVRVRYKCYAGMVHGFLGAEAFEDIVSALRSAFHQNTGGPDETDERR